MRGVWVVVPSWRASDGPRFNLYRCARAWPRRTPMTFTNAGRVTRARGQQKVVGHAWKNVKNLARELRRIERREEA